MLTPVRSGAQLVVVSPLPFWILVLAVEGGTLFLLGRVRQIPVWATIKGVRYASFDEEPLLFLFAVCGYLSAEFACLGWLFWPR